MSNSVAQKINFGIKAGINYTNLNGEINYSSRSSSHFGTNLEFKLILKLAIQLEIMYSSQGVEFNISELKKINYNYNTVPFLVKYYLINNRLNLEAEPQNTYLIDSNLLEKSGLIKS